MESRLQRAGLVLVRGQSKPATTRSGNLAVCGSADSGLLVPRWPPGIPGQPLLATSPASSCFFEIFFWGGGVEQLRHIREETQ